MQLLREQGRGTFFLVNNPTAIKEGSTNPFLRCVTGLCLIIVALVPASAQIEITSADVGATLAPGRTITTMTNTVATTADIGVPGATSWDFSSLTANYSATTTTVRPDTTMFYSHFPGSTNAQRTGSGGPGTIYSYYELGTDLLFQGTELTGVFEQRTKKVPEEVLYQLPMTMGTSWTTTYVESTTVALPPPLPPQVTLNDRTVMNTVDAYGGLTLPGGGVYQALRLRTDRWSTSGNSTFRTISYSILAANGAFVSVSAADTLQPNSGVINVNGISWNNPAVTDVRFGEAVPTDYALSQNFPNPFNPSTVVSYQLPVAGDVRIVVYDLLGQEVATLVNEEKPAGSHTVRFDASGLASGVYLYRLTAGSWTSMRRMLVLK